MRHGRREEGGRLAVDGLEVLLAAPPDLEGGPHLGHLALAQAAQRVGQQLGRLDAELGGDGGRAGQQVVAGHDGHQVAEATVHTLDISPDGCLVNDIVVVERGQVDELDGHATQEVVLGGVTLAPGGRGEGQERPQTLATCGDEVGCDIIEETVSGHDRGGEQGLQTLQSLLQAGQAEGLGGVH